MEKNVHTVYEKDNIKALIWIKKIQKLKKNFNKINISKYDFFLLQ